MSGHITRMSRGSRVGSSWSRPTSTSRRTSTWRAVPWQACTWRLRSSTRCVRDERSSTVGAWLERRSCWSQPSRVVGSASGRAETSPDGKPPASKVRRSSRASRPSEASNGCPTTSADVVLVAGDDDAVPGECLPELWRRLREVEVDVAVLAEGAEQLDLGHRQPRVTEQGQPVGQVEPVTAVPQPGRQSASAGRRAGPRAPAPAVAATARPARSGPRRAGSRRRPCRPRHASR